jgi:Tfp pilus assembly protein PilN
MEKTEKIEQLKKEIEQLKKDREEAYTIEQVIGEVLENRKIRN